MEIKIGEIYYFNVQAYVDWYETNHSGFANFVVSNSSIDRLKVTGESEFDEKYNCDFVPVDFYNSGGYVYLGSFDFPTIFIKEKV